MRHNPPPFLNYAARRDRWRDVMRVVVPILKHVLAAAGAVAVVFVCFLAWLEWLWWPRPVAIVAGPDAATPALVLWWGERGNLEWADAAGRRFLVQRDYYQSRTVAAARWDSTTRVVLEMTDGVRVTIDLDGTGASVDYSRLPR